MLLPDERLPPYEPDERVADELDARDADELREVVAELRDTVAALRVVVTELRVVVAALRCPVVAVERWLRVAVVAVGRRVVTVVPRC